MRRQNVYVLSHRQGQLYGYEYANRLGNGHGQGSRCDKDMHKQGIDIVVGEQGPEKNRSVQPTQQ